MQADLCFNFSKADWDVLSNRLDVDESAWAEAIGVFERRMRERFFSCIDALDRSGISPSLENADGCIPGFSIMAICCLLVETLQGFREKPVDNETGASHIFKKFLGLPAFQGAFSERVAEDFLAGIRNGILHEAETRKWVIWRNRPEGKITAPEGDGNALNRGLFYAALKLEFESYLQELRDPRNAERRMRFRKKMNDVSRET
jgi:hypothetical protein